MTTVDYLRIATWDLKTYTAIAAKCRLFCPGAWQPSSWLQYNGYGHSEGGIFYGSGDQQGERHHVFQSSGENSHGFFMMLMGLGLDPTKVYCTRIDLQQTITHPKINLRRIFKANPRKAKTWIESDSMTIYIGARTSARFTRLYQKIAGRFLRLEHELKGKLSKSIFATCLTQSDHSAILQNQFIVSTKKTKLGKWVGDYFNLVPDVLVEKNEHYQEEKERELKRKLAYLDNTEIALEKYLNDHDLAERTRLLIQRLRRISHYPIDK